MAVKVRIHPFLNEGKELTKEVEGRTVAECLMKIIKENPKIGEKMLDKGKKLKSYVEILVNSKSTYPEELSYPVADGDQIDVIVFLSGG